MDGEICILFRSMHVIKSSPLFRSVFSQEMLSIWKWQFLQTCWDGSIRLLGGEFLLFSGLETVCCNNSPLRRKLSLLPPIRSLFTSASIRAAVKFEHCVTGTCNWTGTACRGIWYPDTTFKISRSEVICFHLSKKLLSLGVPSGDEKAGSFLTGLPGT